MKPDTSRWRTESAYDFIDHVDADQLAWECLRRNGEYQQDYAALRGQGVLTDPLPDRLERRWGLRFRGPSAPCSARPADLLE